MSNNDSVFTYKEAIALVDYAQNIVFEALELKLGQSEDDKFRRSQRMLRRVARLMMWPDRIISESPPWPKPSGERMDPALRELFYKVLGDYSRRVMSLSDEELLEEVKVLVRDYR